MVLSLFAAIGILLLAVIFRLLWVARSSGHQSPRHPLTVCVVLGSGGHTSEMFGILTMVPKRQWLDVRPFYVVSETDKDSCSIAENFERENQRAARTFLIPRAREVGQSYITSILSTLRAFFRSCSLMFRLPPHVILCNGPGVCIPIVGATLLHAALGMRSRPVIAYFESFTCVDHLSLSGRLLLRVADVFTVQWPQLHGLLKGRAGGLRYTGPFPLVAPPAAAGNDDVLHSVEDTEGQKVLDRRAVVTVGSTSFDELMAAIDSSEFFEGLREKYGITHFLIQRGRSSYQFTHQPSNCVICEYKPNLREDIVKASILISHAGAGTILEAMRSGTRTVVVPNSRLMSNHQLQLARALHDEGYLFCVEVAELRGRLGSLQFSSIKPFPPPNKLAFAEAFAQTLAARP